MAECSRDHGLVDGVCFAHVPEPDAATRVLPTVAWMNTDTINVNVVAIARNAALLRAEGLRSGRRERLNRVDMIGSLEHRHHRVTRQASFDMRAACHRPAEWASSENMQFGWPGKDAYADMSFTGGRRA